MHKQAFRVICCNLSLSGGKSLLRVGVLGSRTDKIANFWSLRLTFLCTNFIDEVFSYRIVEEKIMKKFLKIKK